MKFTKMHGCGNDYIYVNGAAEHIDYEEKPEIVKKLSDRHFGIGGDGVIFINPSDVADFEMEMWNADGTRAEMCGNGIRCVAKYVFDKGLTDSKEISIVSAGKIKYISLTTVPAAGTPNGEEAVKARVNMGMPVLEPSLIPVKAEGDSAVRVPVSAFGRTYAATCVSMGNPHAVIFMDDMQDDSDDIMVKDISKLDLEKIGPYFENNEIFPKRTNTEFINVIDRNNVNMRVWERGTGETLACGTGACATAVAAALLGKTDRKVNIHLLGGTLEIEWKEEDGCVYMTGPASTVFEGEVRL